MLHQAGDNAIRKTLSEYRPGSIRKIQNVPYRRVCLQLFGKTGHGKSSLINSCYCVVKDKVFSNVANSGKSSGAITTERKEYNLQDTVYITDNRGINKLQEKEVFETAAQFCQLRPLGAVDWEEGLTGMEQLIIKGSMSVTSDIIVPIYVHRADVFFTPEIVPFFSEAWNITDIFPIVVLTNCQKHNTKAMELQFKELGVNYVIPIENYTTTNKTRNPEMDSKILRFLEICLKEADRGMEMKAGKDLQEEFVNQVVRLFNKEHETLDEKIKRLKENENKNGGCIIT